MRARAGVGVVASLHFFLCLEHSSVHVVGILGCLALMPTLPVATLAWQKPSKARTRRGYQMLLRSMSPHLKRRQGCNIYAMQPACAVVVVPLAREPDDDRAHASCTVDPDRLGKLAFTSKSAVVGVDAAAATSCCGFLFEASLLTMRSKQHGIPRMRSRHAVLGIA